MKQIIGFATQFYTLLLAMKLQLKSKNNGKLQ